jgi:hypothetical protein
MTRTILSSLAVVAMLATSATPAASQAGLSGQQPVPCDCTNCSAEHCPKPGGGGLLGPIGSIIGGFKSVSGMDSRTETYLRSTWERHLASGVSRVPLPDCPRLYPIKDCLASWD